MSNSFKKLGFIEQTCIYLLYPSISNPEKILYLYKNKPSEPTDLKYVGFGGSIEDVDRGDIFKCAKRELYEEVPFLRSPYKKRDLINVSDIEYRGVLIREDKKRVIYMMVASLIEKIPEDKIENEGHSYYKSTSFHQKFPQVFMDCDLEFLDLLYFEPDRKFEIRVDCDKQISRKVW